MWGFSILGITLFVVSLGQVDSTVNGSSLPYRVGTYGVGDTAYIDLIANTANFLDNDSATVFSVWLGVTPRDSTRSAHSMTAGYEVRPATRLVLDFDCAWHMSSCVEDWRVLGEFRGDTLVMESDWHGVQEERVYVKIADGS